jgi:plastocyanin
MKRFVLSLLICALPSGPRAAPSGGAVVGGVVAVKNGKPVKSPEHVYVYLKQLSPHSGAYATGVKATIRQANERFDPRVVVVPSGAVVEFPNGEPKKDLEHNVFSPGFTDGSGRFDLGRYKPGERKGDRTFAAPGELDIYCDIHKDMTAKVKVIDSLWFAPVEGGKFTIGGVPKGRYRVVAWAPDSREVVSGAIDVDDGVVATLPNQLHLQLGEPKRSHKRKDGSDYPPYRPQ